MEEYIHYNTLISKFLSKEISGSELEELRKWLERDPSNRRLFDKENELWQDSSIRTKIDNFNTDEAWADVSTYLGLGEKKENIKFLSKFSYRIISVAASFLFVLIFGALTLFFIKHKKAEPIAVSLNRIQTDEGEKAKVFLCDSTIVTINSGSTLEYSSSYNAKDRVVNLKGEAYFDVRTNPLKPFIVNVKGLSIYAIGTKFNVFSYENEDRLETTLEEGNINIWMNNEKQFDIVAGQQMVFFPRTNKAIIRDVSVEAYTSWKENKLRFIDVPFEEVLRQITRRYNVVFEVRGKDLLNLKYTATFIDESIEEVMQMLKEVSPIKYRIILRTAVKDEKYQKPKIIIEQAHR